jgi:hypothetical protein
MSVAVLLLSAPQRTANAQGWVGPRYRIAEQLDEWKLERDQARLQSDIASGNSAGVSRDLNRIQEDQYWLGVDRRGFVLPWQQQGAAAAPAGMLVPHPQYPGYGYYTASPTRLYPLPQPAGAPNQAGAPGTPTTSAASSAPTQVAVVIHNSEQSGTPVNYLVDGFTYKTDSGQFQKLALRPSTPIIYDRGGEFGVQRYVLSPGVYEFQPSDKGWALFKLSSDPNDDGSVAPLTAKDPAKTTTPAPASAPASDTTPGIGQARGGQAVVTTPR